MLLHVCMSHKHPSPAGFDFCQSVRVRYSILADHPWPLHALAVPSIYSSASYVRAVPTHTFPISKPVI